MYAVLKPSLSILTGIVESLWIQEFDAPESPDAASSVVPTGTVEILFHYGSPLAHVEGERRTVLPRTYITGQRLLPVFPSPTGDTGIILACLYPWSLPCLFKIDAHEITDGYIDLRHLLPGPDVDTVEAQISEATNADQRIAIVEQFLERYVTSAPAPDLVAACRKLSYSPEEAIVSDVAYQMGLSRRHLARRFRQSVGIGPKAFGRIMRFQKALGARRNGDSWASIALRAGYSDQSHMIREFVALSGRTPDRMPGPRDPDVNVFDDPANFAFFDTVYI